MSEQKNGLECNVICWGIAAAVGFVSMVMLWMLAEFTALQAIFTGGLIGFLLGCILSIFVCRGAKTPALNDGSEKPAQRYAREAAEDKARRAGVGTASAGGAAVAAGGGTSGGAAASGSAAAASAASAGNEASGDSAAAGSASSGGGAAAAASTPSSLIGASPAVKPSTPLAGEEELASRKGSWKYDAGGSDAPAASTAAASHADAATAAGNDAAADGAEIGNGAASTESGGVDGGGAPAEAAGDPDPSTMRSSAFASGGGDDAGGADGAALEGASSDGESPLLFTSAPAGGGDDLKLISGVGPKLEQTLNEMGIYRFAQVAIWGPKDIAWVDDRLRFKGRIERDDWMSQAKILAAGGETEFSKRKKT